MEMDPTTFAVNYGYPALPALPPGIRYPYPASTTATSSITGRGMIYYPQTLSVEKRELEVDVEGTDTDGGLDDSPSSPQSSNGTSKRPVDKKLRRQIANSNERRRMQSINQGFHSLRSLMPHLQGEKLSKASVLQHAAEHIYRTNQERDRLIQQNATLRMMLTKHYNPLDRSSTNGEVLSENKVNKATSPMVFDDEKAAARELEQIFATQKELDKIKSELARERGLRRQLEAKFRKVKDPSSTDDDDIDESEGSEQEIDYKCKRPRVVTRGTSPHNNLDIIVRAIREIEGDAFSRSTTPTCGAQERSMTTGTFRPISAGVDSTRVSPVTPVCAS